MAPSSAIETSKEPTWGDVVAVPDQCIVPPTGSGDTMEFTGITDSDHFYGVYLDLVFPVPGSVRSFT